MTTTGGRRTRPRGKWGFFYRSDTGAGDQLAAAHTRDSARHWRRRFSVIHEVGPIFKITEPRTQIRAGRGGKRGRK